MKKNPQDEVYLYLEDFEGNPTRVPQSNAKEFLTAMEKARERIKQGLPPFEEREPTQEELDAKERFRIEGMVRAIKMYEEHDPILEAMKERATPEQLAQMERNLQAWTEELKSLGLLPKQSGQDTAKQS